MLFRLTLFLYITNDPVLRSQPLHTFAAQSPHTRPWDPTCHPRPSNAAASHAPANRHATRRPSRRSPAWPPASSPLLRRSARPSWSAASSAHRIDSGRTPSACRTAPTGFSCQADPVSSINELASTHNLMPSCPCRSAGTTGRVQPRRRQRGLRQARPSPRRVGVRRYRRGDCGGDGGARRGPGRQRRAPAGEDAGSGGARPQASPHGAAGCATSWPAPRPPASSRSHAGDDRRLRPLRRSRHRPRAPSRASRRAGRPPPAVCR